MKSRQYEIKQAVRLGVRKIGRAEIEGDFVGVMVKRLRIITSAVEFVVRDVSATELSEAIVDTFKEIDFERDALEPIARFCEQSLANRKYRANDEV
jgi:hypothetical protein